MTALTLALVLATPPWLDSPTADHISIRPGAQNWAIGQIPTFARDMFGTGVGHAMAYEAMATGKFDGLESRVFDQVDRVLKHPPSNPVDEASLAPTFVKRYGALEKVFDWAHLLHFQTLDVLMHPGWTQARREQEIASLWRSYQSQPFALTGLPMNMEVLSSEPYDGAFRRTYPRVNGLFWGYHWLQTSAYDMLYLIEPGSQGFQYPVVGEQYRQVELYRTSRPFMPMMAEMSPRFSVRFPEVANAFDNLHMLHDNVNDILAQRWPRDQEQRAIKAAIVRVLASTHEGEEPGEGTGIHDHDHPPSMPGMGKMRGSDGDIMYMGGMGWMNMAACAHCSLPLTDHWATVSANGWTMPVRCIMCARDMASETPGRAIIRARTSHPAETLVLISDDEGHWSASLPNVVFLEEFGEHPECPDWSQAFSSQAAFDLFAKANNLPDAKPYSLAEWSELYHGEPKTYRPINRPNPYQEPR